MKNKKLTYILLPVVIFIWGLIIYRIIDFKKEKNIPIHNRNITLTDTIKENTSQYRLMVNYSDPFLKHTYIAEKPKEEVQVFEPPKRNIVRQNRQPVRNNIRRNVRWPEIIYRGMVSDSSKRIIGLLEIDKKNFLIEKGNVINDINVLNLQEDSLVLIYQNDTQTVKLEENINENYNEDIKK